MYKTIIIDSSSNKETKVGLRLGKEIYWEKQESALLRSQTVLPLIDKIVKDHNLSMKDITNIEVNRGPGSFTGLRVGIAIANALAFSLKIPVNNKKVGEIEVPIYE
jgi:tRNA threonylcarbamoyladenosine biosynthesis protein TsaB